MASVNIPDDLHKKVESAVANGACCSVDHYIERTLEEKLK